MVNPVTKFFSFHALIGKANDDMGIPAVGQTCFQLHLITSQANSMTVKKWELHMRFLPDSVLEVQHLHNVRTRLQLRGRREPAMNGR